MYLIILMCQSCGLICRRGYVVFSWGLAACVILGIDLLVTLKGACVCDIFLLVGFVDYLSPEEDWLTTSTPKLDDVPIIQKKRNKDNLPVIIPVCQVGEICKKGRKKEKRNGRK